MSRQVPAARISTYDACHGVPCNFRFFILVVLLSRLPSFALLCSEVHHSRCIVSDSGGLCRFSSNKRLFTNIHVSVVLGGEVTCSLNGAASPLSIIVIVTCDFLARVSA